VGQLDRLDQRRRRAGLPLSQGTVTGDIRCTGSPCSYTNVTVRGTVAGNPMMEYAAIFAKLQGLSSALIGLPANGKVWKQYSDLTLTGTDPDPDLNVFAVDVSAFQNTYSISLKVPATSTAIINVGGTAVAINYASMNVNGLVPGKILWNLYQATTYENKGMSFLASVLAIRDGDHPVGQHERHGRRRRGRHRPGRNALLPIQEQLAGPIVMRLSGPPGPCQSVGASRS
jgi:choice-of-anchor A domain-containing protein